MTVEVVGKERGYKTTQELYTLKYADVINLIKENGTLVLKENSEMDRSGVQAPGQKIPPRSLRPDRTSSEPNLLPPLNKQGRLIKEASWFGYAQNSTPQNRNTTTRSSQMSKVRDGEKKNVRALSPINSNKEPAKSPGPILLSHSPYKLEEGHRPRVEFQDVLLAGRKKRKKEVQNKENSNRPGRDKFVDYLNQKRELTKQIHLRSNHVDFHERPGQAQKNRMSYPMVRPRYREEVSIRNKLEEFKRWHEQEYRLRYTKGNISDDPPKIQRPTSAGRQRKLPEKTVPIVIKQAQPTAEVVVEKTVGLPRAVAESSSSDRVDSKRLKLKTDLEDHAIASKGHSTKNETKQSSTIEKRVDTKARRTKSTKITVEQIETEPRLPGSAHAPESSAKTWRTWRVVDSSYAYQDVKQYIEDNELMPDAKEKMIKDWISDVDRFMTDIQEENEETEPEIGESYPEPIPIPSPTETLTDSSETA